MIGHIIGTAMAVFGVLGIVVALAAGAERGRRDARMARRGPVTYRYTVRGDE